MLLTFIAIVIALFFAMNIGASGAAATMGAVYGAGAVRQKTLALLLVALAVFLGAVLGSGEVVKTIGSGIIPTDILNVPIVLIILVGATSTLFIANLLGIPLSTSEVTVGSIVGVGIAFQALYVSNLLYIVSFWIIVPVVAFSVAYVSGKGILWFERRYPDLKKGGKWRKALIALLIFTGCLEAFSAGMNNVANAIGPLVGAGLLDATQAIWLGGAFVALGAVLLGGRVLETNGKRITSLSLLQGSVVSGTGGTLVVLASLLGIPVPLTQATTSAILGVGTAENGFRLWQKNVIVQIIKVWIVSPILSLVVSYTLVHIILEPNPYVVIVVLSVFVGTFGTLSLLKTIRQDKKSIHEQGGGI
ncbi:sulfate permease [Caldalkalibacillus uzonensis]|uniref:Phosphate transporter n=1 Tax=Caldalkalibacillus uzonensis TaxID=353224 RepID=A0ABU0CU91_9BACI|nr:inorganic phosphate transporter [Caldalkalibacillus uzonensis]MDQ0339983.1 sulfate permease [Caldalkalibacillus uzonensis]